MLTIEVVIAGSPGLSQVEVGITTNVGPREVGMSQKATLAIEGGAVAVETLGEEDHDVGLGLAALTHVGVGHLPEDQRRGLLPHPEGPADGLECRVLPHLGRVVLDAVGQEVSAMSCPTVTQQCQVERGGPVGVMALPFLHPIPSDMDQAPHQKVMSLCCHFRPWMA